MTWLYSVQLFAPMALIGWLLWVPARSGLSFGVQLFGSFTALAFMTLQGIWLLPPWWAPYIFAIALGLATWRGWRGVGHFASAVPLTSGGWIAVLCYFAMGTASTYGTAMALRSRTNTAAGIVNLNFPLESGRYLVLNGGSNNSTNGHFETLNAAVPRYRAWRGQSYGVDLVAVDGFGLRARGLQPADPYAYLIYGAHVLAPCAGRVVIAVDGLPDMRVPEVDSDHLAGNHVLVRCLQADVLLGHLQQGSVRVHAGAIVAVGDWLGSVGNSGNTGEPHLHVHAQGPGPNDAPLGGDPRPIQFNGRFPVRGDQIAVP